MKKNKNILSLRKYMLLTLGLLSSITMVENTFAIEAGMDKKGYDISALSDRSDLGFKSSSVDVTMLLRNASGREAKRNLKVKTLEKENENVGDKSIGIFYKPADISGTALLSHAKILDADSQWLFLKSSKRVKRISSKNKSGPFLGSEFAFEDFTSQELNKYTHKWIKSDTCADMKCDVIKRVPRYEFSGYSYLLVWIDKNVHQVRKTEFYDRKGDLLKTLNLEKYKNYNGYWRAHSTFMENHQTKKSTNIMYGEYTFNVGLKESDFNKARLGSIR